MSSEAKARAILFGTKHEIPCEPISKAKLSISDLAQWLASADSNEQAAFFNEFDIQLRRMCSLKEHGMGHSMQIHWVREGLTDDASYTLADLGGRS